MGNADMHCGVTEQAAHPDPHHRPADAGADVRTCRSTTPEVHKAAGDENLITAEILNVLVSIFDILVVE